MVIVYSPYFESRGIETLVGHVMYLSKIITEVLGSSELFLTIDSLSLICNCAKHNIYVMILHVSFCIIFMW